MSPNPGAQPVTRTSGRTLADCLEEYLEEYLAPPDVVEQLKPVEALFVEFSQMFGGMFLMAWTLGDRAAESHPSKAYEPLLIERGVKPVWARPLASLEISRGFRVANESKRAPAVVGAIRFLASPGRSQKAITRQAEVLLAAWNETSIVDTIFDDAHLGQSEFIGLLKSVVEGREVTLGRVMEIAAAIARGLSIPRGRKISAASATHEFLLDEAPAVTQVHGYTWDPITDDFCDPLTQATRREFGCANFDPRPAHRRLKRRNAVQKGSPRKRDADSRETPPLA